MRRLSQLCFLALSSLVAAEQAYYYNDDANNKNNSYAAYNAYDDQQANDGYGDDAVGDDAGAQQYYYANLNQDNSVFSAGNDYIKYWTDYAILPKRCIV